MKTIIVLKNVDFKFQPDDYLVGIEQGALKILEKELPLELAIGDFDSVSAAEKEYIKSSAKNFVLLNPIKDESDSEAALKYLKALNYPNLTLYGALGKRFDHSFVNFQLVEKYPVTLIDDYNKIFALKAGSHQIKDTGFKYLSIFTLKQAVITLKGVKYPLAETEIDPLTSYTLSNEIIEEWALIEVEAGSIIVVLSRD